jgi:hypothetical protein
MRARTWACTALLTATALLGVGCGDPSASNRAEDRKESADRTELEQLIARAPGAAEERESARVFMSGTSELPAAQGGGTMTFEGPGVVGFDPPRGRFVQKFTGEGTVAQQAAKLIGNQVAVFEDLKIYMRSPGLTETMGVDKEWLMLDLEAAGDQMGIDMSQMMQGAQGNPADQLAYLAGAKDIEKVGDETVRGVETVHYKGVADFEALKEADPEMADSMDKLIELMGTSEVPFEVWLDEDGLPARYSMVMDYTGSEMAASAGKMTMTFEYFDWGVPVKVESPPRSQVLDMVEFIKDQGGMPLG